MSELQAVTANTALRAVRESLRLSQEELARAIRDAGQRQGNAWVSRTTATSG